MNDKSLFLCLQTYGYMYAQLRAGKHLVFYQNETKTVGHGNNVSSQFMARFIAKLAIQWVNYDLMGQDPNNKKHRAYYSALLLR